MHRLLANLTEYIPETFVAPALTGNLKGTHWIVASYCLECWLGTYEPLIQRAFVNADKGNTIYDVGAHVGFFALLASRLVGHTGRVYAFEPLPRNQRFLQRHVAINGISNVIALQMAVADMQG